jgi:lipopolysaccharide/colanic/teichoic acid biosynthesis glycosyltransferase
MAAAAIAVLCERRGPVFFSSERVGLGGRPFRCHKFRTMTHGAGPSGPLAPKDSSDERITPLGRVLRTWSVDELPQLWNVLAGSMSLVGPRPLPVSEVEHLRAEPDHSRWEEVRHRVRPGLTGLWQTRGRSDLGPEDMARLDVDYVENWSLARDLAVLARTPFAVLSRRGAY